MGENPSHFRGSDDLPVETVSFLDAVEFCNELSKRENRTPCYRINRPEVAIVDGTGYRLPTEAEWEYACRAGSAARFPFGDNRAALGEFAWYSANSEGKTQPVGRKRPNAWGLYDMLGNVWEWCQDRSEDDYYRRSPTNDPPGSPDAPNRVQRGGGWYLPSRYSRPSERASAPPPTLGTGVGFRVVLVEADRQSAGRPADGVGSRPGPARPPASPPPPQSGATPRTITNSIGMKLALIPAGEFLMGSPDSDGQADMDEKPQHRVRISRPFYLGVYEVTQGQYRRVTGQSPSAFRRSYVIQVHRDSTN
jgi:formylglycine-generating enzyme required for sulfatase activity